jgi:hypothetical protein
MPEADRDEGVRLRRRHFEIAHEIAAWPSHRSDPPPFEAFTEGYVRLIAEEVARAVAEERRRCLIDIEDGCGRECDGALMIQNREMGLRDESFYARSSKGPVTP